MTSSSSGTGYHKSSSFVGANQRMPVEAIRIENPFTFKALQVFTGFGIGCGVGIGVGTPMHLSALPMVGELMSATRGATNAFSGVTRHVNNVLWKLGAKNVQAGIGCGVGFGHGIGVGVSVKPVVVTKIQGCLAQAMAKMVTKFGIAPNLSIDQGANPVPIKSSMSVVPPGIQNPIVATKPQDQASQGSDRYANMDPQKNHKIFKYNTADMSYGGRTERVISNFLQNPLLKEDDANLNEVAGRLQSENNVLQLLLKHQQIIEELKEDNEKLQQILVEELKISPSKLRNTYSSRGRPPCSECFECRRKQRKR